MHYQSFTKQIEDTLGKLVKDDRKDFLNSIQKLTSKAGESAERIGILLFTLMVVFILIDLQMTQEGSFLGLKFQDLTSMRILIPVVVSYTYLDFIVNISKIERLSKIYKVLLAKTYPSLSNCNLADYFVYIPSLIEYKYCQNELSSTLWKVLFYIVIFLPLLFLVYAIFRLFGFIQFPEFKLEIQTKFSIVCTLLLTIQSVLTLIHLMFPYLSSKTKTG